MASKKTKIVKKKEVKNKDTRRLQAPEYKSFRLSKRIKQKDKTLSKSRHLFKVAVLHLWRHRKVFGGITAVYLVLTVLLVKGLSASSDIPALKQSLQEVLSGASGQLATGLTIFGFLIGSTSGVSTEVAGTYQSMLLIVASLALIWALRQTHAGTKIGVREAFYRGMYPLVPFLVVLLVVGLQCIPLAVSSWLFGVTVLGGLAVTGVEVAIWSVLCFLLAVLSVYMVSSSVFALYVSTLPDMTPMKALRSTRQLVRYRRWEILRKVLFLPVILVVVGALIVIPVILFATPLAEWVFFVLSMSALAISHSYIYSLYRELL